MNVHIYFSQGLWHCKSSKTPCMMDAREWERHCQACAYVVRLNHRYWMEP